VSLYRIRSRRRFEAYDNNSNNMLSDAQGENTLELDASRGGNLDGGNDLGDKALSALGVLALIFGARLSIPNFIAQREERLTEQRKDGIAFIIQSAEDFRDLVVGAADEGVGGDGSGQSHGTAGEDREDSGETHSDGEVENRGFEAGVESSRGVLKGRTEAKEFKAETSQALYAFCSA